MLQYTRLQNIVVTDYKRNNAQMKIWIYILFLITLPLTAFAQQSARSFVGVEGFYSKINVDKIEIENNCIPFSYTNKKLSFNTIEKFKYCQILNTNNDILARSYIRNNKINVKLLANQTYYVRLDSEFSKKYYQIKIPNNKSDTIGVLP